MTPRRISAAVGVALLCSGASGGVTTYFATNGNTLYRVTGGAGDGPVSVETFDMEIALNALSFGPDGRLFGTAKNDVDGDGLFELCEVINPYGPGINVVNMGDFLTGDTSSLSMVESVFTGFDKDNVQIIDIKPDLESATVMGALNGTTLTTPGSSAYDASTGTLYGIKNEKFFEVTENAGSYDLNEIDIIDGAPTGKLGGEWYNGQYYHAINDGDTYHVYTVDLLSGELTEMLSWSTEGKGAAGFAVGLNPVPAPGAAAMLALAGVSVSRRRR